MEILGIDIGGTGIKGALVDTSLGKLVTPRERIKTPQPSTPENVAVTVQELVNLFKWRAPVGAGFPAVVREGVVFTAANIDPTWVGVNADVLFQQFTGCPFTVKNDADAAGFAEMRFGAGREHQKGVVMILTLGTGIGSAVFSNGVLVPNLELGHVELKGKDAETITSDAVRQRKELSFKEWARRVQTYLQYLERIFWPDLFIIGGGGSKHFAKIAPYIKLRTNIIPAHFLNEAGIIGAALFAEERLSSSASASKNSTLG